MGPPCCASSGPIRAVDNMASNRATDRGRVLAVTPTPRVHAGRLFVAGLIALGLLLVRALLSL